MSIFTKEETDEILQVKNDISVYVKGTKNIYRWAQDIFVNESNFYISGGAIASMLLKEAPKDFDVYSRNSRFCAGLTGLLTTNYHHQIKEVDDKYREVDCWKIPGKMVTEKSITMNNNMSFIVMNSGEPDQIKASFDFLHCTPHYDIAQDKLYISRVQYDAIKKKTLIVNNAEKVTSWRMQKFVDRGWNASAEVKALAFNSPLKNKKLTPAVVNS